MSPRRVYSGRSMRRKTQWAGFGSETGTAELPSLVNIAAATPAAILSTNMVVHDQLGLVDEEVTITRMIGTFTLKVQSTAASTQAEFAVGCLVARNEAITAGIGSLPSPEDDPDSEWLWYAAGQLSNPNDTTQSGPIAGRFIDFDVKSQRIVRNGWTTVWICHTETNAITAGVAGRYLVKLT